jgi:hypothetical protein
VDRGRRLAASGCRQSLTAERVPDAPTPEQRGHQSNQAAKATRLTERRRHQSKDADRATTPTERRRRPSGIGPAPKLLANAARLGRLAPAAGAVRYAMRRTACDQRRSAQNQFSGARDKDTPQSQSSTVARVRTNPNACLHAMYSIDADLSRWDYACSSVGDNVGSDTMGPPIKQELMNWG